MTNSDIRKSAREALRGNWGNAVLFVIITTLINGVFSYLVDDERNFDWPIYITLSLLSVVVSVWISTASEAYYLSISRGQRLGIGQVFGYAFRNLWPFIKLSLLVGLKVLAWTLLLIIPGIIAGIRYSQAVFIKIDNPGVSSLEAIRMSSNLMNGHKWRYFCLMLSFIGWAILSLLTLFLGFLWLEPYFMTSLAEFYNLLIAKPADDSSLQVHEDLE
ncbi:MULTISPECIES: DUF975 family protein [Paenibacillus]|uniref:DUF975 family protein n=1 Tax=Paenibacillus TaxID=44249 RepID=UPI0022B93CBA|nr:DUF975 family protein [Paenibacillus caseinilyticus]MCZ8521898.1 DUF975 family protein [Paenibacillus caseinilyticus]